MTFTHTTAEVTGLLRTSENTLRRLRREGVLKPGRDFIAIGAGKVAPNLLWNPSEVEKTLAMRSRKVLRYA